MATTAALLKFRARKPWRPVPRETRISPHKTATIAPHRSILWRPRRQGRRARAPARKLGTRHQNGHISMIKMLGALATFPIVLIVAGRIGVAQEPATPPAGDYGAW